MRTTKGTCLAVLIYFSLFTHNLLAQTLTQSIRGRVVDADTEMPLIGANVVLEDTSQFIGAVTDVNGNFKIANVPVGRVSLNVSYIGYNHKRVPNILVNSAKESFLTIQLIERVSELNEVTVTAKKDHSEPLNEMAIISARTFSVEEAKRYAGSFGDPARMASGFAGVTGDAEGNNDIVVRGNSPKGILWRVEGVEAPNPNHFADEGATGGPINALNSKVLSNSEFLTGAFAPEYGNATSGVFDIQLRQGNNEQREYTFGFGILGTDITLEGPFSAKSRSSYLINYRYSSLAILDETGVVDFGGVPKYQDAAFKFYFPTKKYGIFSFFGFGGFSRIVDEWKDSTEANIITSRDNYGAQMALVGLNHTYMLNHNSYVKTSLSFSNNGSDYIYEYQENEQPYITGEEGILNKNVGRIASTFHKKFNAKNKVSLGAIYSRMNYSFDYSELTDYDNILKNLLNTSDYSGYLQAHGTWKHRLNNNFTVVSGLHFLQFNLNNTYSIEPRLGLRYQLKPNQILTAGFGVHSKIESLLYYTTKVEDGNGQLFQANKNLELPKSNHYVIGYDYHFSQNTHAKIEAYYQSLYDIAIANDSASTYSLINQSDWFDDVALTSEGKGRNYGIEFTLERFFNKGFFYLLTTSIYESQYRNMDGVWRKTRFNGNYTSNLLIGKEFAVGKNDNNTILASIKATFQGGNRYTPIDLERSIEAGTGIRSSVPFSAKGDDVLNLNVSGSYRINKRKTSHEIKFEIINATNNQARTRDYYNSEKQSLEYSTQMPIIPNIMYLINF